MNTIIINTPGPQGPPGANGTLTDTGSLATTGSNTFNGNQTVNGYIDVTGNNVLNVNTIDESTTNNGLDIIAPVTRFTHDVQVTGSLEAPSITGSLQGTSSWAYSASNALTASYILNAISASYSNTASYTISASYSDTALYAISASYSDTASYVKNAISASYSNTASYVLNAVSSSYSNTASYVKNAESASYVQNAQTASYISLIQGPGITINGLEITASVQKVNGAFPIDGNVATVLSATRTGTSASLIVSSSGTVTGSIADGLVWIISNDPDPTKNGDVYIFNSSSIGQWYPISPLDTSAADARYLKLDGVNSPMTGDVNMGGNDLTNVGHLYGTASWADSASYALTASYVKNAVSASYSDTASYVLNAISASYSDTASYVKNAVSASYILNAVSASYANTASYVKNAESASYVLNAISASYSDTASYITGSIFTGTNLAQSASYALTASYVPNAVLGTGTVGYLTKILNVDGGGNITALETSSIYESGATRTLSNSGDAVVIDYENATLNGKAGEPSVDAQNRTLIDSSTNTSINYENRTLLNSNGDTILDYQNENLFPATSNPGPQAYVYSRDSIREKTYGTVRIDLNSNEYYGNGQPVIRMDQLMLFDDIYGNYSLDWRYKYLYSNYGYGYNWGQGDFNDSTQTKNVNQDELMILGVGQRVADSFLRTDGAGLTYWDAGVQSVNGVLPTNGNVSTTLSATRTGTSASLVASSSGNITGSLSDGLVWVISNDPTPANNGDVYIFSSGSVGQWYPISPLDTPAADARYLKLDGGNPMTGDIDMGANNITNVIQIYGTASWANNAQNITGSVFTNLNPALSASYALSSSRTISSSQALTASYITGSTFTSANPALSASYALTASYALNGGGSSTAGYIQYPLSNYAGADFGAKLQNAINSVPTGSVIDCYMISGSQTISSTVTIDKPVTILLGKVTITANVGANTNVFELKSNNISIIGKGRASKSSEPGQTRILMTTPGQGYHINSTNTTTFVSASNVTRIQDLDLVGDQSTQFTTDGSGGIFMAEPDPFVSGGGNALNQVTIEGVYLEKTKGHAITLLGLILSSINNTRISQAGGHGVYVDSSSTSTLISNTYVSSATLAGFCLNGSSYSNFINCGAEGAGIGYWIKGCFNVTLTGCGAESNVTRNTTPNNLGITVPNSVGTQTLNDIGSDYITLFKGHSFVVTGGRNIIFISPLSALPGQVSAPASNTTRHFLVKGSARNVVIQSPRCSGTGTSTGAYDIGVEALGATVPSDVEIIFNPSEGTKTSTTNYLAGIYITSSNTVANSTTICDQGTNTLVRAGNKIYTNYVFSKAFTTTINTPGLTLSGIENNYDIKGYSCVRIDGNSGTLTGILAQEDGFRLTLINIGGPFYITNLDGNSLSDNQIITGKSTPTLTINQNQSCELIYDAVDLKWRVLNNNTN